MAPDPLKNCGPSRDCPLCPRLVAFREEARRREPSWHNAPVPSFGPETARLLIVGLAPGLRGANRTGRPFTGDWAGDLLYETLIHFGFAAGTYDERPDDGLQLVDCRITNAVRCVPPENKPTPAEINICRPFLSGQIDAMPNLQAIVCLGRIAHDSTVRALGERPSRLPFGHGADHRTGSLRLFDSYHCSRLQHEHRRPDAEDVPGRLCKGEASARVKRPRRGRRREPVTAAAVSKFWPENVDSNYEATDSICENRVSTI